MTLIGLLILASGFLLMTLAGTPVAVRRIRGLFFGSYAGVILTVGILVNIGSGFALSTHSLTIPSMRDDLGISYTQVGLLITVAGAVRMSGSLVSGALAPRYGSRYLIGVGTFVCGASMLLLGYSPNYFTAMAATALIGLGSEFALIPMMGLVAPWFEMQNRGLAAGVFSTGGSIAMIATGLLVPLLVAQSVTEGWRNTWSIFGVLVIIIAVASVIFLRDRPEESSRDPGQSAHFDGPRAAWPLAVLRNPWVWLLSYLAMCTGFATGLFNTFFGAYLTNENGISLSAAGQLFFLVGVLSVGSGILWGRVSDRLGRGRAFALSFVVQGIGYALFWLSPMMAVFILASTLIGLTFRAGFTLCAAGSGDHVPANFAAAAFALMSVGAGLGSTLSPIIAGTIADNIGIGWVFALGVGSSLMGIVGALALRSPSTSVQPAIAGPAD